MAGKQRSGKATAVSKDPHELDFNDLYSVLYDAMSGDADVPEPGYYTSERWGSEWGVTQSHALKMLRKGMQSGIVEVKKYRIKAGDRIVNTRHFRKKPLP